MKKDESGKTRNFIKQGLILWGIIIVIFVLIQQMINNFGDIQVINNRSGFFGDLSSIIFMFGVCGIPLILFLSIALKFVEKAIDKIGDKKE